MDGNTHDNAASQPLQGQGSTVAFAGYPRPTSNTTYTPNQFFDVVLPHSSRGVVRLVGYMIRKVLGWSNPDGSPREPQVRVSYSELTSEAGISRGAIRESIDEALRRRFITCVTEGSRHHRDHAASSSLFELRWDDSGDYKTDLHEFQGFFSGNGNLTYIPNAFFDHTVRNEPLALVRVVGAVIRHSIGFQTRFGFRRQEVSLSFDDLLRITRLGSRSTLNIALKEAEAAAHIVRLEAGSFGNGAQSKGKYAIRWEPEPHGTPANADQPVPTASVQKSNQGKSGVYATNGHAHPGAIGSKIEPGTEQKSNQERFKNRTSIEITGNNTSKEQQQQGSPRTSQGPSPAAAALGQSFALLREVGFDEDAAGHLARRFDPERIRRQVEWLPRRKATRSRLGLLRMSIEGDYPEPGQTSPATNEGPGFRFAQAYYAAYHGDELGIARPFTNDPAAAEGLLARLMAFGEPHDLGKAFGVFVRSKHQGERNAKPFLSSAINAWGAQFARTLQTKTAKTTQGQRQRAREEHERAHRAHYEDYLRRRNAELSAHPAELARFEEHLEAGFEAMRQFGIDPDKHRTEAGRLASMADFFGPSGKFKVLGFWDWDNNLNPNPFPTGGVGHAAAAGNT